ncbi:DUF4129 domain-containing protein [Schumannella luteola]
MLVLPFDVPVDPDADEARELLIQELSKPQYQAARPTLFDQIAQAFWDWLSGLQIGGVQGPPAFGLGLVLVLVAAAIVVGILIFGLPRLNRRSAVAGSLFGEDDHRDAAAMRRDARAAAAAGDWATAIAEMFRATARGLAERTILTVTPGTTASGFAARAATAFPSLGEEFAASARSFDEVRYLSREGTREQFDQVAALEEAVRSLKPATETVDA